MRKIISIILAISMVAAFGLMTACGGGQTETTAQAESTEAAENVSEQAEAAEEVSEQTEAAETEAADAAKGFVVESVMTGASVPNDVQEAFDKAMETYSDGKYADMAYLGSQVVAGVNYAFLCTGEYDGTTDSSDKLSVVIVYQDLDGNCSVSSVQDFDLDKLYETADDTSPAAEQLAGGWTVNEDMAIDAELPQDAQENLESALEGFAGSGFEPVLLLGQRTSDGGTDYAILCKGTLVTETPVTYAAVVFVNVPDDGTQQAQITKIANIDIGEYNN